MLLLGSLRRWIGHLLRLCFTLCLVIPGSESCSSFGSSSSSLSRPHCPFTVSVSLRPKLPGTPCIHPAADTKGSALPDKSVPSQPTPSADATNYAMALEASGVLPGRILVNPNTGTCAHFMYSMLWLKIEVYIVLMLLNSIELFALSVFFKGRITAQRVMHTVALRARANYNNCFN